MKVADIALAVLIQLCVLSVTEVAGGKLRHHRRRHGGRGGHGSHGGGARLRRLRVGRQEEVDTTTVIPTVTTVTTPVPAERYDLTSYGDYDESQESLAPPLTYGAPPPQQDINDVYVGDVPDPDDIPDVFLAEEDNVGSGIFDNYDDNLVVAASDTGDGGDGGDDEYEEEDAEEEAADGSGLGSSTSDEVPAWCDPTHPMGAWLNYFNIQVTPPCLASLPWF